jgi:hypothetical protein
MDTVRKFMIGMIAGVEDLPSSREKISGRIQKDGITGFSGSTG